MQSLNLWQEFAVFPTMLKIIEIQQGVSSNSDNMKTVKTDFFAKKGALLCQEEMEQVPLGWDQ